MSAKHSPLFWRLFSPHPSYVQKHLFNPHPFSSLISSSLTIFTHPFSICTSQTFFFVFLKSFYSVYSFPDPLFQPLFSPLSVYLPDVFEHVKFIPMVSFHHTPLLLFSTKKGKVFQAKPFGGEKRNSHEANPVYFQNSIMPMSRCALCCPINPLTFLSDKPNLWGEMGADSCCHVIT